jgi:hypothetical protein
MEDVPIAVLPSFWYVVSVQVAVAISEFFIGPLLIEYHVVGIVTYASLAFAAVTADETAVAFPQVTVILYRQLPTGDQVALKLLVAPSHATGLVTVERLAEAADHCAYSVMLPDGV